MSQPTESVRSYLAAQVARMRTEDAALATAGADAVHDARVACRRVRSTLRTFPALADDARRDELGDRLRAWSDTLGAVRDLEVLRALLAEVCPEDLVAELTPGLDGSAAEGRAALEAARLAPEHRALLDDMEALALGVPVGRLHPRRRTRAAVRRARKRLARAGSDPEALHAARKAAKRARYAAEAIADDGTAAYWKSVQDALGDHHDCVVAVRHLAASGLADEAITPVREELERRAADALTRLP